MIARALLVASIVLAPAPAVAALAAGEAAAVMPLPGDARAQLFPAVAHDGQGTYLVVWQQGRLYHESQQGDILAARIDARGRVLDRQPIVVCDAAGSQERPQVAFSSGVFLIVWHDLRNGRDWDVYAARVGRDGRPRERNGLLVAGGAHNQANPVVAPADDGFLVVWQDYDRYYRLAATTVPTAGPAAPPRPLRFNDEALWGGELALARAGRGWLLSWNDEKAWSKNRGLATMITRRFARLGLRDGVAAVLAVQRAPTVHVGRNGGRFASDGDATAVYAGWGLVGRGNRAATAARFGGEGASALRNPNPEKAKLGSGWDPEYVMTLYAPGVPVDGPIAVAFGQGIFMVAAREAYTGRPGENNRLFGSRLTRAGVRIDQTSTPPLLHESAQRIANPALAGGAGQFLLAFEQEDATGRRQVWTKIVRAE